MLGGRSNIFVKHQACLADELTCSKQILKEDKQAQKQAPQVLKDQIKTGQPPPKPQSRPFSTSARSRLDLDQKPPASLDPPVFGVDAAMEAPDSEVSQMPAAEETSTSTSTSLGHKFPLPTLPLPSNAHKDYRYDPVVRQVTNLLMRDGKLSVAQRNMSTILQHLRTASPPTYNPAKPLLPGARTSLVFFFSDLSTTTCAHRNRISNSQEKTPLTFETAPASHLPLNPTLYLTLALDSVAPLLRIRSQRGAAGGGVALQIPVPLGLRQRRRQAFTWILDSASKRKSRSSGRNMLAQRVAEEIVSVVEGRSTAWEKRLGVHKLATTARSNLSFGKRGRR